MINAVAAELFDLEHTVAKEFLGKCENIYEIIPQIKDCCKEIAKKLGDEYIEFTPDVFVARDAVISDKATVIGPAIIGRKTEVRPGAYIRGAVIIGDGAVIGNSTEIKNAIVFDGVQLPHYNYVGDSILGYRAHLGAGAVISNVRLDRKNITVKNGEKKIETGLKKMGALIGDLCEIGCNSVICPGSILGKGTMIYPLSTVNGVTNFNWLNEGEPNK